MLKHIPDNAGYTAVILALILKPHTSTTLSKKLNRSQGLCHRQLNNLCDKSWAVKDKDFSNIYKIHPNVVSASWVTYGECFRQLVLDRLDRIQESLETIKKDKAENDAFLIKKYSEQAKVIHKLFKEITKAFSMLTIDNNYKNKKKLSIDELYVVAMLMVVDGGIKPKIDDYLEKCAKDYFKYKLFRFDEITFHDLLYKCLLKFNPGLGKKITKLLTNPSPFVGKDLLFRNDYFKSFKFKKEILENKILYDYLNPKFIKSKSKNLFK